MWKGKRGGLIALFCAVINPWCLPILPTSPMIGLCSSISPISNVRLEKTLSSPHYDIYSQNNPSKANRVGCRGSSKRLRPFCNNPKIVCLFRLWYSGRLWFHNSMVVQAQEYPRILKGINKHCLMVLIGGSAYILRSNLVSFWSWTSLQDLRHWLECVEPIIRNGNSPHFRQEEKWMAARSY